MANSFDFTSYQLGNPITGEPLAPMAASGTITLTVDDGELSPGDTVSAPALNAAPSLMWV